MDTQLLGAILTAGVSVISIAVSVLLVILQINNNAKEQLKADLAGSRSLIIASMYCGMDLAGRRKTRVNFTRYVAKTPAYLEACAEGEAAHEGCAFVRLRNESNNHAHGVHIRIHVENRADGICFEQEYTINIVASFCEYLFFVPRQYSSDGYFDAYRIDVSYSSVSGENIRYQCVYDKQQDRKVLNRYSGSYPLRRRRPMETFRMQTLSDTIETIEYSAAAGL